MKIAIICGSPKGYKSASYSFLKNLNDRLTGNQINFFYISGNINEITVKEILKNDQLVFAFPNYFGGVPSQLLRALEMIEKEAYENNLKDKTVYAVVNCGFYYSNENRVALETIHCFCKTVGFRYGKGISIGGGGSVNVISRIPVVNLYLKPISKGIDNLVDAIRTSKSQEDQYLEILMPIKIYIFIAEKIWYIKASKNGLKGKHALDTI